MKKSWIAGLVALWSLCALAPAVADSPKTRNVVLFRPSPFAVRCAQESVALLSAVAEEAGMPVGALQVIPDAAREVTHYLFRHPGVDFPPEESCPEINRHFGAVFSRRCRRATRRRWNVRAVGARTGRSRRCPSRRIP